MNGYIGIATSYWMNENEIQHIDYKLTKKQLDKLIALTYCGSCSE